MTYWNTYQNMFHESIVSSQSYEKSIQSMLQALDKSQDPCHHRKQLLYLENILRTKSDSCTSLKAWIPFVFNYKDQTRRRAEFFQRQAASAYTQCLQYTERQSEKRKYDHQQRLKREQENTKRIVSAEQQKTERQRIEAMKLYSETKTGIKPEFFRK